MQIKDKINCKVPFGTLTIPNKSKTLVNTLMKTKMLTNGQYVKKFETEFAKKFDRNFATAVSSGTDAVALALAALHDFGMNRGDTVLLPALTFIASANAILQAGFIPKFVDIDRKTLNIDPYKLEDAIDGNTRAILVVHLMGNPADMDKIMSIAQKYDLFVIEDCAEAHGAKYKNKHVGSYGLMSCYSLYAAHIVSSIEGGMITTNEVECDKVLKSLRNHGLELKGSNWTFERVGYSAKMNELEAVVGLSNLEQFAKILKLRKRNFEYLHKIFQKWSKYFLLLNLDTQKEIGPHAFSIIVKETAPFSKEEFVNYLSSKGIDNRNLFYSIPTQCAPYKKYCTDVFPEAEFCSNFGTHIGVHQDLTLEQLKYVEESVQKFVDLYDF